VRPTPHEFVSFERVVRNARRSHELDQVRGRGTAAPEHAFSGERDSFVAEGDFCETPPVVHVANEVVRRQSTSSRKTSLKA